MLVDTDRKGWKAPQTSGVLVVEAKTSDSYYDLYITDDIINISYDSFI